MQTGSIGKALGERNVQMTRFWSRLGGWLRAPGRSVLINGGGDRPDESTDVFDVGFDAMPPDRASDTRLIPAPKPRPRKTDANLERLEETYAKIFGLVESIQAHCQVQDRRSQQAVDSLDQMVGHLAEARDSANARKDLLSNLAEQVTDHTARTRRMEENLAQLPRLADAQRESLAAIGRQLDSARQTADRATTTLTGLEHAVSSLGEATVASAKSLRQLHEDSCAREERMADLLSQQTKRMTYLAWIAAGAALTGAVLGFAALLR